MFRVVAFLQREILKTCDRLHVATPLTWLLGNKSEYGDFCHLKEWKEIYHKFDNYSNISVRINSMETFEFFRDLLSQGTRFIRQRDTNTNQYNNGNGIDKLLTGAYFCLSVDSLRVVLKIFLRLYYC
jgi:hypothetical protein